MKAGKFFICIAFLFVMTGFASAQTQVKGLVYVDANGNGRRDRGEKGLASVGVSNGVQVVTTDEKGQYLIGAAEGSLVFVIKPTGYGLPVDSLNKPVFFRRILTEDRGRRLSYDFGLVPTEEPQAFTALIFGDPQPHFKEHVDYFEQAIVEEVKGIKGVTFGISMGDISDEDKALYEPYNRAIAKIGVPWYNLMGNHDLDYEAKDDSLAGSTFRSIYGPTDFAFNVGQAHFLVLDNIYYPEPGFGGIRGGFRQSQFEFIKQDLATVPKDRLIVVAFHIPLLGEQAIRPEDKQRLFQLFRDFPNLLFLSAHTHIQQQLFHDRTDGWEGKQPLHEYNIGTTCGDWYSGFLDKKGVPESMMADGTPKGYAFLNIDGNRYTIDYKVAGKSSSYQLRLNHPNRVVKDRHTPALITANFFMGYTGSNVSCRIDDGDWMPMKKTDMVDPTYQAMYFRWNASTEKRFARWPSMAGPSSHIWSIRMPSRLPLGRHRIQVKAEDHYGREFMEESHFEVEAPLRNYP